MRRELGQPDLRGVFRGPLRNLLHGGEATIEPRSSRRRRGCHWQADGVAPDQQASGLHIARGSRTLTEPELQAVLNTVSLVSESHDTICGADKPLLTLTVESADTT